MHTAIVIAGGLTLLLAMIGVAWLAGREKRQAAARSCLLFLPVWLICAVVNMWIGVSRAGYSVGQELVILVPVFGVPAAIALVLWWYLRR